VFIKALQDLKATSERGASGLGQLTEREGDKIQNAKAALDPQQPTPQYKRTLGQYIARLKAARGQIANALQSAGRPVPAQPMPISDVSHPQLTTPETSLASRKAREIAESKSTAASTPVAAPKPVATGAWTATKRSN
jgi:hypothetical protein